MNQLRHKSKAKIEPSRRDSISTWLDVLTAMLVMPESQRTQVRDELEDHLRSRVDDLLIIGKPEPEAIQTAVAELGETAELAKLITHAHTRINPRRKIMNAALITIALAGMSFGGFSFINGTGAPSATPNSGGAVPAVVPEEARKDDDKVHQFNIEQAPMMEILVEIADAFDQDLVLSQDARSPKFNSLLGSHYGRLQGEYTFKEAIDYFEDHFSKGFYGYQLNVANGTMLLQSFDEYQKQLVELRVYEIPSWIHLVPDHHRYADSVDSLLGMKFDLAHTSIQVVSDSIVVAAPPEIQSEFVRLTAELDASFQVRTAKKEQEHARENAKLNVEYQQQLLQMKQIAEEKKLRVEEAIREIQAEFESVRSELLDLKSKTNSVISEIRALKHKSVEAQSRRVPDPAQPGDEELIAKMASLNNTLDLLEFELDEMEERYMYLRARLLESQYAELFDGLE